MTCFSDGVVLRVFGCRDSEGNGDLFLDLDLDLDCGGLIGDFGVHSFLS